MSLPQVHLDERSFQDLVSEARLRIGHTCPEWTEHNVSDPGITLIELFAWMTDMLIYRLNRVPDKLHVALLELLGVRLQGPAAARTDVRFRTAAPVTAPLEILAGTEVGTVRTASEESVVFGVRGSLAIPAVRPDAYVVQRAERFHPIAVANGTARPRGSDCLPFGTPPAVGDALYLGFEQDISRLLIDIEIDASKARGTGIAPEDPPLRWEMSRAGGEWAEAEVLADRTGGFNYGRGTVEIQCPRDAAPAGIGGRRLYWLRCRIAETTRGGDTAARYTQAPEIYAISAAPMGALVAVEHSAREVGEPVGVSDGTPGQDFRLRFRPVLKLIEGETLEVREPGSGRWVPWRLVDSFATSGPEDRHFTLDESAGEIELGPALRQPHGGWRQRGRVPPQGAELRMSAYRHGGGLVGNVAAGTLSVLRQAVPGIAEVSNPRAAQGGVDPEPLESARRRAGLELRTRYRAVTGEDYEFLAAEASPRVARALCASPSQPGDAIELRVLPKLPAADRMLSLDELTPDEDLLREIAIHIDSRRVIGTTVHVLPVRLRGVSVVVNLQAEPHARLQRVEEEVLQALYTYLNPLTGGSADGAGSGWPFGRMLNQGELYSVVHAVAGVQFVTILRVYEADLRTGQQAPQPAGSHLVLAADEVIASGPHIVKAGHPGIA